MRKTLTSLMLALVSVAGILSSCVGTTPVVPGVELEVLSVGAVSAEINLKTSNLIEYAWMASKDGEVVTDPNVLFVTGNVGTLVDGDNVITINGIEGNSTYTVSVAFKISVDKFYEKVLTAELTTSDYEEGLTLVNTTCDGFTVHFKRPSSIGEGNVVKYGALNIAKYNDNRAYGGIDADMLNLNDEVYGNYWTGDGTLTYNDDNMLKLDEKGNPVVMYDDYVTIHDKIAPGEPMVLLVGEYAYGESMYGWGEGYYEPLFDMDAYYEGLGGGGGDIWGPLAYGSYTDDELWTGYHDRIFFVTKQPSLLDAQVKVDIEPKATNAVVKITPEEGVFQYCYFICDNATYEELILPMLDGNEDYLQWFVTSEFAFYSGAVSGEGAIEINLNEYTNVEPENKYHFIITAMGDEDGLSQNFQHIVFDTPAKTGKAPEVVVTEVDPAENSPFAVYFNIKCPSKNAVAGKYAANYCSDFELQLHNKFYSYTYNELVDGMGNYFSADEVAKINSDEGLTISFSTVQNEKTRLAVLLYNDEDTPNTINDEKGAEDPAVAESLSDKQQAQEKVDSPLFKELLGDWTMTGDVTSYQYINNVGGYYPAGKRSCKVTITDGITYPETLSEEVYALYEGKTKEYVDGLYSEFKKDVDVFNEWLKGQNRLLCLGFGYVDDRAYYLPGNGVYKTPYDLFVDTEYSGYDNRSLIWDFGPKWYLEIAADGSVSVPFNNNIMYPMCGWTKPGAVYMAAYGDKGVLFSNGGETLAFPVSAASGSSTVTINPIVDSENNQYYPAAGVNYSGYFYSDGLYVDGPLSLTKGWIEPASSVKKSSASKAGEVSKAKVISASENAVPMFRRTSFKGYPQYKKVSYTIVDKEQYLSNRKNAGNNR